MIAFLLSFNYKKLVTFENILVPYDGSKPSFRAFKKALEIAKKFDSRLKLVTFIGTTNVGAWYIDSRLNKQIMTKAKKFAKDYLSNIENVAKKENVQVDTDVLESESSGKRLLSYAKTKKINLIVMGSSGKGKFDRFLLGSTSNLVVQKAECPVLIVK